MQFEASGYTNIGQTKKSNQDSFLIEIADTNIGNVALIAVADGMGGLAKGELASAHVVNALSNWFEKDFKESLELMNSSVSGLESYLTGEWNGIVQNLNLDIMRYGRKKNYNLGTTLTAMLFVGARYSIVHVGDSRAYEIKSHKKIKQLTKDQTFVYREVQAGRMSKKEAKTHPKRNVLLQCIGYSKTVKPEIIHGNISKGAQYLICSDGFRHQLKRNDYFDLLDCNGSAGYEKLTKLHLKNMANKVMELGESDNITAVALHAKK